MRFYLMRHAEAESGEQMDPTRSLTDTGWKQIPIMADFLQTQTNKIKLVMHSEFKRGKDTAKEMAKLLKCDNLETPKLGPHEKPAVAWKAISAELKKLGDDDELLVVSHGPLINVLIALLLDSGEGYKFHFSHASIAHLDTETPPDAYAPGPQLCYLHWMATAKLVNKTVEDDRKAVIESALKVIEQFAKSKLREAAEDGDTEKAWIGGTCPDCQENSEAGFIPIDDLFPSGDDEPPAHPNCDCDLETR